MAYPDLPQNPTFWRCPKCGNESLFRASGIGHIECTTCHTISAEPELLAEHARAHPSSETAAAH
jgi:hypothetical protein